MSDTDQVQDTWVRDNLEVLAEDQTITEGRLAALERNQKIMAGVILGTAGGVAMLFKVVGVMMKNMAAMGQAVAAISGGAAVGVQQGMAMAAQMQPPPPIPMPMVQPNIMEDPDAPLPVVEGGGGSDTYDPGPQVVPLEVQQALAMEDPSLMDVKGQDKLA